MKKIKLLWMAMLTLMLPALQSCDDNDGYSLGDIAVDWATTCGRWRHLFAEC